MITIRWIVSWSLPILYFLPWSTTIRWLFLLFPGVPIFLPMPLFVPAFLYFLYALVIRTPFLFFPFALGPWMLLLLFLFASLLSIPDYFIKILIFFIFQLIIRSFSLPLFVFLFLLVASRSLMMLFLFFTPIIIRAPRSFTMLLFVFVMQ